MKNERSDLYLIQVLLKKQLVFFKLIAFVLSLTCLFISTGISKAGSSEIVQQVKRISGTVTDQSGAPLPGVSVVGKGTTVGMVTGIDGKYALDLPASADALIFSFIGMTTQEVPISGRSVVDVAMSEVLTGLDEVVVVGYGTQRKVNLSGSITTVAVDELSAVTMPTLSQSIMGRSPGLFIKNVNGQPGDATGISMNIRGFGAPLIIIDGVPATDI